MILVPVYEGVTIPTFEGESNTLPHLGLIEAPDGAAVVRTPRGRVVLAFPGVRPGRRYSLPAPDAVRAARGGLLGLGWRRAEDRPRPRTTSG